MTAYRSENAAFDFETYVGIVSSGCVAKPTGKWTYFINSIPRTFKESRACPQCFMVMLWNFLYLWPPSSLWLNQRIKTPVKGCIFWVSTLQVINDCLQRKSERSYNEAKGLLKRQLGYPFLNDCKRPTSPSCLLLVEQTMAQLSTISLLLWTKQSLLWKACLTWTI